MKNKSLITLLILVLIIAYSCVQNKELKDSNSNISWIRFKWEGDSIGNKYYKKLAMFIPFKLENVPYKFTSQLDLGAPVTMIYGNAFSPLLVDFPDIAKKLDTIKTKYVIQGKKVGGLHLLLS